MARDSANTWWRSLPAQPDSVVRRLEQPYTKVRQTKVARVEITAQGPLTYTVELFQVDGFTPEWRFIDEDYRVEWEHHDLGEHESLVLAHDTAQAWRAGLVNEYEIR